MSIRHLTGQGDGSIEILFDGFQEKHREIALILRQKIADIYQGVVEIVWKKTEYCKLWHRTQKDD